MKNKNDLLKLGLIATGAIFLFNPTVNIVDPLPDFIGFWLIAHALTAVAYMSDRVAAARKSFVYLALVEALKLAVCVTLPGSTGTFVVLMAFCFSIAEAVLFLPAVDNLFEGFSSLGVRYSGNSIFSVPLSKKKVARCKKLEARLSEAKDEKSRKALSAKLEKCRTAMSLGALKIFTSVAFLVRAAGAVLPTLPNLALYNQTLFVTEGQVEWSNYSGVFYIIAWIAGFWVGIPWLCRFRAYWNGVANDLPFSSQIYKKYAAEILSDKGRLCAERMKKVMLLAVSACVLTFCFPVDYVNIVPNFFTAGVIIAALVYLIPYSKKLCIAGCVSASLWAVFSGIGTRLQSDYVQNNYDPPAAVAFGGVGRGAAKALYFRIEIFSYIEAVFFLVTALIFAKVFADALNSHIDMMPPRRDGIERDRKALTLCLRPVAISGAVVIAFNFALTFVTKWFTGAWLVNTVAVAVLFVFALRAYYKLWDEVYTPLIRKF